MIASLAAAALLAGCGGGDEDPGREAIRQYGCGTCHAIPGVRGADGNVGPPLAGIADRAYIAGKLPNTRENLIRWISSPQEIEPGTVMPDVGASRRDVEAIVGYLTSDAP